VETIVAKTDYFLAVILAAGFSFSLAAPAAAQLVQPAEYPKQPAAAPAPLRELTVPLAPTSAPQDRAATKAQPKLAIIDARPETRPPVRAQAEPPFSFPFEYPSKTSLADLVEQVSPAVVNIIVKSETAESVTEGQGSGFIIDAKGEVVTNYHVIDGGTSIEVEFNNGERFAATVVGTDPETDLAVLKIDSQRRFKTVSFHQKEPLRIGDWVVAIGNPFGIGQSTSFGIISAIGRKRVESGAYVDYIQTDATINTGNSGGPLFNPEGDVVGVNSAIYSPTGASVGIGFSIPHQTAEAVVTQLRREGRVRRGWLGAGLRTAEFSQSGGVFKGGATINNIVPGSPADIYGLKIDDVLLNVNGNTVRNSTEATRIIGAMRPNQKMSVIYEREEKPYKLTVMIGERPDKEEVEKSIAASSSEAPTGGAPAKGLGGGHRHGMGLVDLSAEARSALGMRYDQVGIYVESVAPNTHAAVAGIPANSVLMQVDHKDIPSVPAFEHMIFKAQERGEPQLIILVRLQDGQERLFALGIPLR
jgi:serine protease Do